jgi:tRNA-specific 2-thiouridylase
LDGEPLYVVQLNAADRRVVVGPISALARTEVSVRDVNWLAPPPISPAGTRVEAKLRSAAEPAAATVTSNGAGAMIAFDQPQFGVAPGQAAVFYNGTQLLGGGWITA